MHKKYIVFKDPNETFYAISFPTLMNHADVARAMENGYNQACLKPVSAGEIRIDANGEVYCYGESVTLKMKADPERDSRLFNSDY